MSKKDRQKLQQTFMKLDTNADGKLSRDELIQGYKQLHGSEEEAVKEVDNTMKNVDIDHDGYIDYSGMVLSLQAEANSSNDRIFIGINE